MNILFVTDGIYPFVIGGMQKHAAYLIRQLADTSHNVDVIITQHGVRDSRNAEEIFWQGNIPQNIRFHVVRFPQLIRFPGHYLLASYLYSRRVSKKITPKISTYDILFGKGFSLWHYLRTRKEPAVPVIVQLHGLEMYQPSYSFSEEMDKRLIRIPASDIIRKTDYMFSYGGQVKQILIDRGKKESTIFEQYGAIDDDWLNPEPLAKTNGIIRKFLFVARYELRKGYHVLKPALEALLKDNESFTLDMVGEVPQNEQIQNDKIRYHGQLNASQIKQLMEENEVLLVPSLSEGFPTIIVEAMARGMAVAATPVGAVESILNKENGWLLETGKSESIYETMKRIIRKNPDDLTKKQARSRFDVMERFQWKFAAKQLVLHLEEAVNDYRAGINGQKPEQT